MQTNRTLLDDINFPSIVVQIRPPKSDEIRGLLSTC